MKIKLCALIMLGVIALTGCGGGGGGGDGSSGGGDGTFTSGGGTPKREALDNYVNGYELPILRSLDNSATTLLAACQTLVSNPTDANLQSARAAWVASRIPWEQSEAALFGPVDFYGFDPALDSWPVNRTDLEAVLASGSPLNAQTVANLDNSLKGYHTIEYLIYGVRGEKTAANLTAREGEYLIATAQGLKNVTSALLAAWVDGIEGQQPYAREVVLAGQGSPSFPSETTAVEQFARGISGICDEVANGKIADPFDQRNPNIVESQFSGNSLADFGNNIRGAELAYQIALSDLVAAQNPALDNQVRAAFTAAIAAIGRIPEPFLEAIQNSSNDSTIIAAQQAVRNVQNLIDGQVLPIVLS